MIFQKNQLGFKGKLHHHLTKLLKRFLLARTCLQTVFLCRGALRSTLLTPLHKDQVSPSRHSTSAESSVERLHTSGAVRLFLWIGKHINHLQSCLHIHQINWCWELKCGICPTVRLLKWFVLYKTFHILTARESVGLFLSERQCILLPP